MCVFSQRMSGLLKQCNINVESLPFVSLIWVKQMILVPANICFCIDTYWDKMFLEILCELYVFQNVSPFYFFVCIRFCRFFIVKNCLFADTFWIALDEIFVVTQSFPFHFQHNWNNLTQFNIQYLHFLLPGLSFGERRNALSLMQGQQCSRGATWHFQSLKFQPTEVNQFWAMWSDDESITGSINQMSFIDCITRVFVSLM